VAWEIAKLLLRTVFPRYSIPRSEVWSLLLFPGLVNVTVVGQLVSAPMEVQVWRWPSSYQHHAGLDALKGVGIGHFTLNFRLADAFLLAA
jgi:hypothetical protein